MSYLMVELPIFQIPIKRTWLIDDVLLIEPTNKPIPKSKYWQPKFATNFICKCENQTELLQYLTNFINFLVFFNQEYFLTVSYNNIKNEIYEKPTKFEELHVCNISIELQSFMPGSQDYFNYRINGLNPEAKIDFPKYFAGYLKLQSANLAKRVVKQIYLIKDQIFTYNGLYDNSAYYMSNYIIVIESILKDRTEIKTEVRNCQVCGNPSNVPKPTHTLLEEFFISNGNTEESYNVYVKAIKELFRSARSAFVHNLIHYNEFEKLEELRKKLGQDSLSFQEDIEYTKGKANGLFYIEHLAFSLAMQLLHEELVKDGSVL